MRKTSYILSLLFIVLITWVNWPFGERCLGATNGIISIGFLLTFFFYAFAVFFFSIYKNYKLGKQLIYIPLIALVVGFGIVYSFFEINTANPFNKRIKISGITEYDAVTETNVYFFEDNTFTIKQKEIEQSCYVKGKYELIKKTLYLNKKEIEVKTDSMFTNEYKLERDSVLIPLKDNFPKIKIEAFENNYQ